MTLKEFSIKNLFGFITESLKFSEDASIAFIAGKNGSGKTTILKTIDAIANKKWHFLLKVNFQEIVLRFFEGQSITIHKKKSGDSFKLIFSTGEKSNSKEKTTSLDLYDSHNVDSLIEDLINSNTITQLNCGHWADEDDSHMVESTILNKYGKLKISLPTKVDNVLNNWETIYVGADRQISDKRLNGNRKKVKVYEVENITQTLKDKLIEVQSRVRENLDEINVELVKKIYEDNLSSFKEIEDVEFISLMDVFIAKKNSLERTGLSVGNIKPNLNGNRGGTEKKLVAYIIEKTLEAYKPYESLLFAIDLFDNIVNSALSNKKVIIELPEGLNVKIQKGKKTENFSPLILSSGEQQVIILAYSVLFTALEDSLVLIDEPELSMDVDWQTKIYGWLKKIAENRKLKMILSTHSPLIVMGKDDSIMSLSK